MRKHIKYNHFKMEWLSDVFKIIQTNSWMASFDLKDAFYSTPITQSHLKKFKFSWKRCYKYVGVPYGYSEAMRIFTKNPKPLFVKLRNQGHLSVPFVDDSYLKGNTYSQCCENVNGSVNLLQSLEFSLHQDKSVLEPTQSVEFLCFIIDSVAMEIRINPEQASAIVNKIDHFLKNSRPKIGQLGSV